MELQKWERTLASGLKIKETFDIGLLNRIRLIRQARKWGNDLPAKTDYYKVAAKVCAYIGFGGIGMMLWYLFLAKGLE
ncbi:MAG: hypothetical protein AAB922_05905 [Patescibacteria group bacterium]